ncbi:MAG: division/cell wall cluster transcriptional repressor MraZ [Sandaracinaceae bacterium]|nr:division/cell wall cluster transcriptional repressor MraZ [Sandaracinaceae bacterium]
MRSPPLAETGGRGLFRGQYEHAIDGKGRTSVPSRFREALGDETRLVITTGLDPCLVAYPMSEWALFEERLSALPRFDPSVAMIRRIYVSGAVEMEIDKLGRVLIPASLRDYGSLERNALWAGMGKHLELWSKERFDELRASVLADPAQRVEMARRLAELGL